MYGTCSTLVCWTRLQTWHWPWCGVIPVCPRRSVYPSSASPCPPQSTVHCTLVQDLWGFISDLSQRELLLECSYQMVSHHLSVPSSACRASKCRDTCRLQATGGWHVYIRWSGGEREREVSSLVGMSASLPTTEPGYYEDGKFGIRIENIVQIVPAPTKVTMPLLLPL